MATRLVVATSLFWEVPEQTVPAVDDVRVLEGPGERTPNDPDLLHCDAEIIEAETPQEEGLGFVIGTGALAVGWTHDPHVGAWTKGDVA